MKHDTLKRAMKLGDAIYRLQMFLDDPREYLSYTAGSLVSPETADAVEKLIKNDIRTQLANKQREFDEL